jgi:hypothetical protein
MNDLEKRNQRMTMIGDIIKRQNDVDHTKDGVIPKVGDILYDLWQDTLTSIIVITFPPYNPNENSRMIHYIRDGIFHSISVTTLWADPIKAWENYRQECLSKMREINRQIKSLKQEKTEMGNKALDATNMIESAKG